MLKTLKSSISVLVLLTIITGFIYPLAINVVAKLAFPYQAGGSIVKMNGIEVGSELIGQNFSSPKYFHGRPSAAGQSGYDALSSSASNLGPTSSKLIENAKERAEAVKKENGLSNSSAIPSDLVLTSGSGLDPDISRDAAMIQAKRVANSRGISIDRVEKLIHESTEMPTIGFIGKERVNVLKLNISLDALK